MRLYANVPLLTNETEIQEIMELNRNTQTNEEESKMEMKGFS